MSIRFRMIFCGAFQFSSYDLNPQVSFIVMQLSQSTPGKPLGGICCSGVPKSPEYCWSDLFRPSIPFRPLPTRLLMMIDGFRLRTYLYKSTPSSSVHQSCHSPSNQSTAGSYAVTNSRSCSFMYFRYSGFVLGLSFV